MKKNIFIVDDEKGIVETLVEQIEARLSDCKIDYAFNGEDALQQMLKTHYDVLITDLSMPKLEGNDLIRGLGEQNKKFYPRKIIVISGYINLNDEKKVIENIHFLEKPYKIEEIVAIIKES